MLCEWDVAKYLIFSTNIEPLIYYSHVTSILIFICLIGITFLKLRDWPRVQFRLMAASYILWLFCDLVLWANEKPDHILFFWTMINLVEPLIFIGAFAYFARFVSDGSLSTKQKWFIFGFLLPTLVMAPLGFSAVGFDLTNCDRNVVEGSAAYYNYFIEAICLIGVLWKTAKAFVSERFKQQKTKLILMSGSISFLLLSFLAANFLGTYFDSYTISQYGHIAVPIFAALLAYLTIKYESFEPRILLIDVLVTSLLVLLVSLFFVRNYNYQIYVNTITLIIALPLGYMLVTSIRKETKARKQIEALAANLQAANTRLKELDIQKTEFISFATHQLRSPLTSIKGNTSLILEGDTGPVPEQMRGILQVIYTSIKTMGSIVEDYLNMSRLELGTMKYNMVEMDFKDLLHDVMDEQKVNIEAKGLTYSVTVDEGQTYKISADPDKFKQVIMNTIDNSIKYTPKGSLAITLTKEPSRKTIRLKIADTGVGIKAEVMPKLFRKFFRAPDAAAANIHGTGLGLFIAKEMMNAHHGRIWAESEGEGKGSQFYVEMPEA